MGILAWCQSFQAEAERGRKGELWRAWNRFPGVFFPVA
jgi:hypothetical protein